MTITERIAHKIENSPRLRGVPVAVIEDIVDHAMQELAALPFPDGALLEDVIEGEWHSCESCDVLGMSENMKHDEENVAMCPSCADELAEEQVAP